MDDPVPPQHLESRVGKVEVALENLHEDVAGIKLDLRGIAQSVNTGFDQLRREQSASKQTNWGWIAAFIAVGVSIAGGVMTALVMPLNVRDEVMESRKNEIKATADKAWEQSIRNDERLKHLEKKAF
jgi:hypothetical protein